MFKLNVNVCTRCKITLFTRIFGEPALKIAKRISIYFNILANKGFLSFASSILFFSANYLKMNELNVRLVLINSIKLLLNVLHSAEISKSILHSDVIPDDIYTNILFVAWLICCWISFWPNNKLYV